jgi:hypothetical protein
MRRLLPTALFIGAFALAGCAEVLALLGGPDSSPPVMIITGTDDNHTIITEPLREIRPEPGDHDARLYVGFENPRMLGIEGGVLFLKATDPAGNALLDVTVDPDGAVIPLPPGQYTLNAYSRSCDGNCGLLDPPNDLCSADARIEPDGEYRLTVDMSGPSCTFR